MKNLLVSPVFILLFASCDMPDDERCAPPYEYRPAEAACVIPVDTEPPSRVDTSPVQEGLGAECYDDSDCATYGPEGPALCLRDPLEILPMGMCTFTDCDFAACGGRYLCCDCSQSTTAQALVTHNLIFCADPVTATTLTGAECVCD